jgi:hypothetical protein
MPQQKLYLGCLAIIVFTVTPGATATIVLNAISGNGSVVNGWVAGGPTLGDDVADTGGTNASYSGKVPNKRFYVPLADTLLTANDTIYSVYARVRAKATINMAGTYDGVRIAVIVGASEFRDRVIHELDSSYNYYSSEWTKNPITALPWTWADVCSLQVGIFTAKRQQSTFATYIVDHIQIVVTYSSGRNKTPPIASSVAISGTPTAGLTLNGMYVYSDGENDPEGVSTFKWYRAVGTGTNDDIAIINGATGQTYQLGLIDVGQYISFGVVPVSTNEVYIGQEVVSAYAGPVASPATGVIKTITSLDSRNNSSSICVDIKGRVISMYSPTLVSKGIYILINSGGGAKRFSKVTTFK